MIKNKKGFIGDVPFIIAMLFLFAIVVFVGYKVFGDYNDKWQAGSADANAKQLVQDGKDRYVSLFDGIFMFVFAGLCIALFISLTQIGTRPEFFFITLILLVILIGVGALLSNTMEEVTTSSELSSEASEFSFIPFFFENLPIMVLLLGAIFLIGSYLKLRGIL